MNQVCTPASPAARGWTARSRESRDQGFTLIELLVVVIIVGVLAAIAVPVDCQSA